jgi:hypothetical protein
MALWGYLGWTRPRPQPPTTIFQGIVYSCEEIPPTPEGSGLLHLVEVDLNQPGIGLYVTPLDPEAMRRGFEYRLRWTPLLAGEEKLSVLINGALFACDSRFKLPGAYARSGPTVVAEHRVNHVDPDSYLLWFEDDLTPHLETTKPPPAEALRRARWGVSDGMVLLAQGKVNAWAGHQPFSQVLAGIDSRRKRLFLAVLENASRARAAKILAEHGAVDAIALDSGHAASMTIGHGAAGIGGGTLLWPKHGSATQLGVRALPSRSCAALIP